MFKSAILYDVPLIIRCYMNFSSDFIVEPQYEMESNINIICHINDQPGLRQFINNPNSYRELCFA